MYEKFYIEKELSWLSFNERVLQEAADKTVPIIERVRFLGIFSSNLDEFYRVRFSDVKRRILITQENSQREALKKLLGKIQNNIFDLNQKFDELYNDIILEMARRHIFLVNETQLQDYQEKWIRQFFQQQILPHIVPFLLNHETNLLKFLKNEHAYFAIEMNQEKGRQYVLIDIPTDHLQRFIVIPEQKGKRRRTIILLDNIIRFCLDDLFKGFFNYKSINCYTITLIRDAKYDLRYEVEHSLIEQMSESVNQRLTAMPVRFTYQKDMPEHLLQYLCDKLNISNYDSLIPTGRYHNFKDFVNFPNIGRDYLENKSLTPLYCKDFDGHRNYFQAIQQKDILLYYPYYTFNHILELVREASFDPKVLSIKINIYRVAKYSKLMNSLMDAVHNGKKVTVVVELQARFDETANINWSKTLTEAGVHVVFGVPGLKIHSKLLLIGRREKKEIKYYAHIGTGNFHEKTACIYTDFALLTADPRLTQEVKDVFNYIENPYQPVNFNHLIVSPKNAREKFYQLINNEINHAKQKKQASITLKINNLVDKEIIHKLYDASNAGVKINMIIRGMCSLVPGIKGVSENISIISIVDRFLEHPRVIITHNLGNPKVYISSADWMTRNFDRRIEVAAPIFDTVLKQRIIDIINIHKTDTVKARRIDKDRKNEYIPRGNKKKIRSQIAIYDYLKQIEKNKK